jgi:hypothetical protein
MLLHSDLSTLYVVRHHFNLLFYNIILIGRTDFIYFVHMFLGILPTSAAREPRFLVGFVLLEKIGSYKFSVQIHCIQ